MNLSAYTLNRQFVETSDGRVGSSKKNLYLGKGLEGGFLYHPIA